MNEINSVTNNIIKETVKLHQKKYRDEYNLFIVEGEKALWELINNKINIINIFVLKNSGLNINHNYTIVSESVMKKLSSTDSVPKVVTVASKVNVSVHDIKKEDKIILLENISDAGNLGTIIRSCAAFGFKSLILLGNCVDLYSPKVLRSTAGNFFKVNCINIKNISDIKEYFIDYKLIATSLSDNNNLKIEDINRVSKYIVMFGSEAKGLEANTIALTDYNITIPMMNNVESLNLGVSVSIIMYRLFSSKIF